MENKEKKMLHLDIIFNSVCENNHVTIFNYRVKIARKSQKNFFAPAVGFLRLNVLNISYRNPWPLMSQNFINNQ